MEDAYTAVPFLLEVPVPADRLAQSELIPPRIATHVKSAANSPANSDQGEHIEAAAAAAISDAPAPETAANTNQTGTPFMETLHFFGVFDGHGGAEAALHCAQTLHQRIAEALSAVSCKDGQPGQEAGHDTAIKGAAAESGTIAAAARNTDAAVEPENTAGAAETSGGKQAGGKPLVHQQHQAGDKQQQQHQQRSADRKESNEQQACPSGKCPDGKCVCNARSNSLGSSGLRGTSSPTSDAVRRLSSGFPDAKLQPLDQPRRSGGAGSDSGSESETFLDCLQSEMKEVAKKDGQACSIAKIEDALTNAFTKADEEFGRADNAALVGTTAVVALVGSRQLYVANCGDSRAVLCRNGVAIPLTDDHKAAREDETARVEAAGGQILFWNGVRVMGVLAVSRAIGDHCLRPFVIARPEITILGRRPDDELMLLASDGLWDVLTNQEACSLAKRCLRRARQRGATRQSAARIAATVLTRAAVDRGSRDNVTVVVVDLSSGNDDLSTAPSSMGDTLFEGLGSEADSSEGGGYQGSGQKSPTEAPTSQPPN
jgi:protein phosphatase 2C